MLALVTWLQTASWRIRRQVEDQRGQTSTEYLMIAGAVAVILVGVLVAFKGQISNIFSQITKQMGEATKK